MTTPSQWGRYLMAASNVAILLSAGVIVVATLLPRFQPAQRGPSAPRAGVRLPNVEAAGLSAAGVTCLLFLRSDCSFCTESMPFYQKLAGQAHSGGTPVRVVAVTPEDVKQFGAYLHASDLAVDSVLSARFSQFGVEATPTLVLVDGKGKVLIAKVGKLSSEAEEEVLRVLKAL